MVPILCSQPTLYGLPLALLVPVLAIILLSLLWGCAASPAVGLVLSPRWLLRPSVMNSDRCDLSAYQLPKTTSLAYGQSITLLCSMECHCRGIDPPQGRVTDSPPIIFENLHTIANIYSRTFGITPIIAAHQNGRSVMAL